MFFLLAPCVEKKNYYLSFFTLRNHSETPYCRPLGILTFTNMITSQESIQLLNTAIIKSKECKVDNSYEDRLAKICESSVITALDLASAHLSEVKGISKDQAAIQMIETIRELDSIWGDYVMMEGLNNLKNTLKNKTNH